MTTSSISPPARLSGFGIFSFPSPRRSRRPRRGFSSAPLGAVALSSVSPASACASGSCSSAASGSSACGCSSAASASASGTVSSVVSSASGAAASAGSSAASAPSASGASGSPRRPPRPGSRPRRRRPAARRPRRGPGPRSAPRRCPSAARRRGRPCRSGRAGSRALPGARRRGPRSRVSRSSASAGGTSARRPTPKDCLRTVKVSRAPEPWRLRTMPSKTWVRAAASLDHLEVDAHAIAGVEGGKSLPDLGTLDAVDDAAHCKGSLRSRGEKKPPEPGRAPRGSRNGTYSASLSNCSARARLCSTRQRRTLSWSPESRTSGTSQPR